MIKLTGHFLLLIAISVSTFANANSISTINYTITPDLTKKTPYIKVDTEIKGKLQGKVVINLPDVWGGANHYQQIKDFKLNYPKGTIQFKKSPRRGVILTIPKTKILRLSYKIYQKPNDPSNVHETIIRKNLIHFIGHGVFAVPDHLDNKITINITWKNLPQDWQTLSSHGNKHQINLAATDLSSLLHSVYISGKLRIFQIANSSSPVYLSLYGNFDLPDDVIASNLSSVIKTQRSFFNDSDFPSYTISLIEEDKPKSYGGTGLHNSFAAYFPKNINKFPYYLVFAHEHLHNWIGYKIRNSEPEELNYWWSEGFTDYYSRVLALRSDEITDEKFINEYNDFLKNYYLSPVINVTNKKIKRDFRKNCDMHKIPYYRGFLFATYLNYLIKKTNPNHSLDNVLFDLLKEAKHKKFSAKLFQDTVKKYLPQGINKEFSRYIDQGQTIKLDKLTTMLPIEKTTMGPFDLGFDEQALLKTRLIKKIDKESNAYKAGLRNGDKVTELNAPKGRGNPDQIITIKTTNKTINFRPENLAQKKTVYQLKQHLSQEEVTKINKFFGVE